MTRKAHRSLNSQLLLLGALPAVLMFVGLMLFFTTARLSDAREDLFQSTQTMADNLAPALEYAVVSGNHRVLQQVIERSQETSRVEWIRVTDVLGKEIGVVAREGLDPLAPGDDETHLFEADILQQPLELTASDRTEWFEPDYRLSGGSVRLGSVEVAVSERLLTEKRYDIMLTSGVVGISLLVFTLLLVNRMLAPVIDPMRALAQRVTELTKREYRDTGNSARQKVAEIAELEENLDELARHLRQLKESRDHTLALSENARQRAESANRAKSEFLAIMSHELRTPLNGVLGMVDLVTEEPLSHNQQDYLTTAKRSTEDLLTLINDILDYSQLDQGSLLLESGQFNPLDVVENCLASFRHSARLQGLELELSTEGDWQESEVVRGDAIRFRQILASLIDNAIKFSDYGTIRVTLDWHQEGDDSVYIGCEVADDGHGIPPERTADIFNGFEQVDSSSSRSTGGAGIGLALVQKLVELMGGHIRLNSALGKGSSFRFEIPFDRVKPTAVEPKTVERNTLSADAEARSVGPSPSLSPAASAVTGKVTDAGRPSMRALVVEDNPVNQRVARALLERLGFDAEAVDNGKQAIATISENGNSNYAVILMDCQMPVMDGYEATQAIRQWEDQQNRKRVPIIALTADALPGTEIACREAGMNDYLAKPVRKHQLRTVLSRWVPL